MAMYQNSQKSPLGSLVSLGRPTNHMIALTRYGDEDRTQVEQFYSSTPNTCIVSIEPDSSREPPMGGVAESYFIMTLSGDDANTVIYRLLDPLKSGNTEGLYLLSTKGTTWGSVSGTLSNQTDLQNALDAKASTSDLNGKVSKSGDTMTGSLGIVTAGEAYVQAKNSTTNIAVFLDASSSANHGVWSNGYYNGSTFRTSGKWIIRRGADGEVYVNDQNLNSPTFTQASSRTNIASGENVSTLFGKIRKWFTDLKDLAFIAKDGTSSTKYLRGDGTWQAITWGNISGTLSNQTDLQNALNAKLDTTNPSASGTFTMDGSIEIPPYTAGDPKYISSTGEEFTFPVEIHFEHDTNIMHLSYGGLTVVSSGLGARYSDRGAKIKVPNTSDNYVNLGDTVLWTNPSPTASFASQTVSLTFTGTGATCLEDFDYYQIVFRRRAGNYGGIDSTGLIPTANLRGSSGTDYIRLMNVTSNIGARNAFQNRPSSNTTTCEFGAYKYYTAYNSSSTSTNNEYVIPVKIIGWKFHN